MVGQCQETSITSKTTGMFIQIIALNTDSCLLIIQLNCIQVFLNYFCHLSSLMLTDWQTRLRVYLSRVRLFVTLLYSLYSYLSSTAINLDKVNLSIGPLEQNAAKIRVKSPDSEDSTFTMAACVLSKASWYEKLATNHYEIINKQKHDNNTNIIK